MKKLTPLTEYIDYLTEKVNEHRIDPFSFMQATMKRTKSGKRKLFLGQFIACNKEGKPLEKPNGYDEWISKNEYPGFVNFIPCKEYQEAQSKVLFEGWEVENNDTRLSNVWIKNSTKDRYFNFIEGKIANSMAFTTIESVSHLGLILTDNGIKAII